MLETTKGYTIKHNVDVEKMDKRELSEIIAKEVLSHLSLQEEYSDTGKFVTVDLWNGWYMNIIVNVDDDSYDYDEDEAPNPYGTLYQISTGNYKYGFVYLDCSYTDEDLANDLFNWCLDDDRVEEYSEPLN